MPLTSGISTQRKVESFIAKPPVPLSPPLVSHRTAIAEGSAGVRAMTRDELDAYCRSLASAGEIYAIAAAWIWDAEAPHP